MSNQQEQGENESDENFQAGYNQAIESIEAELHRAKTITTMAQAHRMLTRSLDVDDTRSTLAEIENAICRLVRKVAPDAK